MTGATNVKFVLDSVKQFFVDNEFDINDTKVFPETFHSRLLALQDKAGKTRVVATGDVFTQTVFKPLFDFFCNILRSIEMDVSFDEAKGLVYLKSLVKDGTETFSFDLSSATDRLPEIPIRSSLTPILG